MPTCSPAIRTGSMTETSPTSDPVPSAVTSTEPVQAAPSDGSASSEGANRAVVRIPANHLMATLPGPCLLYTSDAADERSSVDLGGRRIIKKKNHETQTRPTSSADI